MLFSQGFSDGAQSGPVPERPQRGQFRRNLRNRRAMSCGARQMALAKRVRMSWVQWRRSLRRHARRAAVRDGNGRAKRCELADLLVVIDITTGGTFLRRAALIQAGAQVP